jgi:hypothetical protein
LYRILRLVDEVGDEELTQRRYAGAAGYDWRFLREGGGA